MYAALVWARRVGAEDGEGAERRLAVKTTRERVDRVGSEARLLAKLSHPNILRLHHLWWTQAIADAPLFQHMALDKWDGTLAQRIADAAPAAISPLLLRQYGFQLFRGLHALHSAKVRVLVRPYSPVSTHFPSYPRHLFVEVYGH